MTVQSVRCFFWTSADEPPLSVPWFTAAEWPKILAVAADRLIFPNAESYLRLVRALAVEAHENWLEAIR